MNWNGIKLQIASTYCALGKCIKIPYFLPILWYLIFFIRESSLSFPLHRLSRKTYSRKMHDGNANFTSRDVRHNYHFTLNNSFQNKPIRLLLSQHKYHFLFKTFSSHRLHYLSDREFFCFFGLRF